MRVKIIFFTLAAILSASCGPLSDFRKIIDTDLYPPLFLGTRALNEQEMELEFDERIFCETNCIQIYPELKILDILCTGQKLIVRVAGQTPGKKYTLKATVEDERGNSLCFMTSLYGFNPEVPQLVINEFTTRGTGNHPDVVELKVLADGNMGGVTLYQGTPGNWQDRLIFAAFTVKKDDFILVHFKPGGTSEEIDETEAKDISGGLDASDQAYDFWIPEGKGISGNNGVLSVYDRPGGVILDGVLYSERTSLSDERYLGFGTLNTMKRAIELVQNQGWLIAEERVRPEDGINPQGSTGTRSICRDSTSTDTDTKADWHIVPTRGATFGMDNSDAVYQ